MSGYFDELEQILSVEFNQNKQQLSDFLKFPRNMKSFKATRKYESKPTISDDKQASEQVN